MIQAWKTLQVRSLIYMKLPLRCVFEQPHVLWLRFNRNFWRVNADIEIPGCERKSLMCTPNCPLCLHTPAICIEQYTFLGFAIFCKNRCSMPPKLLVASFKRSFNLYIDKIRVEIKYASWWCRSIYVIIFDSMHNLGSSMGKKLALPLKTLINLTNSSTHAREAQRRQH
jgi:hypothetical protein